MSGTAGTAQHSPSGILRGFRGIAQYLFEYLRSFEGTAQHSSFKSLCVVSRELLNTDCLSLRVVSRALFIHILEVCVRF